MTRQNRLGVLVSFIMIALWATGGAQAAGQNEAAAAVKASPELVATLSKEIGGTPEQAAGAAGALFSVARAQLKTDEFSQIARAVPGMDALLRATPAGVAAEAAKGMSAATSAFTKLGLKPEMVAKAVPVLASFVTKSGGATAGRLLTGALK
jgi:hypothetical protein